MGIYAWHKLLPYPVPPFCPLASPPAAAVAKQKGKPTFLLKLPFNHWIIASAGTSLSLSRTHSFHFGTLSICPSPHWLTSFPAHFLCSFTLCLLISTIYFNKPPSSTQIGYSATRVLAGPYPTLHYTTLSLLHLLLFFPAG